MDCILSLFSRSPRKNPGPFSHPSRQAWTHNITIIIILLWKMALHPRKTIVPTRFLVYSLIPSISTFHQILKGDRVFSAVKVYSERIHFFPNYFFRKMV